MRIVLLVLSLLFLASCAPSEQVVQDALRQTEQAFAAQATAAALLPTPTVTRLLVVETLYVEEAKEWVL